MEREPLFMAFCEGPVDLCCLGDSITQKFEWQDAFRDIRVANRGIGSDTTEGMLARIESDIALQPKTVSILAGINDLVNGQRTPEEITAIYGELIDELQINLPDTQIIVTSILPVTGVQIGLTESILETNQYIKTLCTEHNVIYMDIFEHLADEEGHLRSEYALDDVHLSVEGYEVWINQLSGIIN